MSRRSLSYPAAGSVIPFLDVGISRGSLAYPTVPSSLIPFASAAAEQSALVELDSTTLGAPASEITFSGISQDYTDLMLSLFGRGDAAVTNISANLSFNSDTGTNYDKQRVTGVSSTVSAGVSLGSVPMALGLLPGASAPANVAGGLTATAFDYVQTSWQKAVITREAHKQSTSSGGLRAESQAYFWRSTNAITSITLTANTGNFATNTTATLYAWR